MDEKKFQDAIEASSQKLAESFAKLLEAANRAMEILERAHLEHHAVPLNARRHRVPFGECHHCDMNAQSFGPSHDASPRCESGKRNHCTCDTCF